MSRRGKNEEKRRFDVFFPLNVAVLAADDVLREATVEHLISMDWYAGLGDADAEDLVQVTISLDYPLTAECPVELRVQTHEIEMAGEAFVIAADMYSAIYELNEKIMSEGSPDAKPLVWGHDISDLIFEGMKVDWENPGTAHISFFVANN